MWGTSGELDRDSRVGSVQPKTKPAPGLGAGEPGAVLSEGVPLRALQQEKRLAYPSIFY